MKFFKESNDIVSYTVSLDHLSELYQDIGLLQEAEIFTREELAISEKIYGKNHPNYMLMLMLQI